MFSNPTRQKWQDSLAKHYTLTLKQQCINANMCNFQFMPANNTSKTIHLHTATTIHQKIPLEVCRQSYSRGHHTGVCTSGGRLETSVAGLAQGKIVRCTRPYIRWPGLLLGFLKARQKVYFYGINLQIHHQDIRGKSVHVL